MEQRIYLTVLINIVVYSSLLRIAISQASCDSNTQCQLDYDQFDPSKISCTNRTFGPTADPCYGHWSSFSNCQCVDPYGRISQTGATYWCQGTDPNKGKWATDLYSLKCYDPCTTDAGPNAIARSSNGTETTIIQDGDYVLYSCPRGYTADGTSIVTCTDGKWDDHIQFVCLADCDLPENYVFENGSTGFIPNGGQVSMRCQDGYTPTDLIVRECDNGTYVPNDYAECQLDVANY